MASPTPPTPPIKDRLDSEQTLAEMPALTFNPVRAVTVNVGDVIRGAFGFAYEVTAIQVSHNGRGTPMLNFRATGARGQTLTVRTATANEKVWLRSPGPVRL